MLTHILGGHPHAHHVAHHMMRHHFGWTGHHQYRDLDKPWNLESGWNRGHERAYGWY